MPLRQRGKERERERERKKEKERERESKAIKGLLCYVEHKKLRGRRQMRGNKSKVITFACKVLERTLKLNLSHSLFCSFNVKHTYALLLSFSSSGYLEWLVNKERKDIHCLHIYQYGTMKWMGKRFLP